MHISEGVLSAPVLVAGALLAAGGLAVGLRSIEPERLPGVALFSSAFFVASLVHIPIPPTSAHLILNGLLGVALGWAAFPAIFVALALQAFLFQFGGITTLGVNACVMSIPPVVCWYVMRPLLRARSPLMRLAAAFVCGFGAVLFSGLLAAVALRFSGENLMGTASAIFVAHIPIALCEGAITAFVVHFLTRVRPEFLALPPLVERA